jgi:uncharacterized glyoxalase superfamily protein PhnB
MDDPFRRSTFGAALIYRDPLAALDFLEKAFGFERTMVITDAEGRLAHAEMRFGDGYLMVGSEWAGHVASPASLGGKNTQTLHVRLDGGLDAHCARARAAGAEVFREPAEEFYGDRVYGAKDPEGHAFTFSETVRVVSRADAEAASGLRIDGWH